MRLRPKVNEEALIEFTRDLGVMLNSGVGLVKALEVIGGVGEPLLNVLRSGHPLSIGMLENPDVFDAEYVSMVRAGEASGKLPEVLKRLAERREAAMRLKKRLKSAMVYPLTVLSVAITVLLGLVLFVVPRFEQMYTDVLGSVSMPAVTSFLLGFSKFAQMNSILILSLGSVVVLLVVFALKRWNYLDGLVARLPLFRGLVLRYNLGQFSRVLGELLASGIGMREAIVVASEVVRNAVIRERIHEVYGIVSEGNNLSVAMESIQEFPKMMTQMVRVGESSGTLPEVLGQIALGYEDWVDRELLALSGRLEPLLVVGLAVIIGTLVVVLFLPIIGMMEGLSIL